ncbi:MAG: hypothetical protein ABGX40_02965 [Methylococcales bacterium]
MNAAFFSLRIALIMFGRSKPLLIFCEDGNSSEVADFLILKNKLNTLRVMRGMAYEAESRPTDTQTLNQADDMEILDSIVLGSNAG